MARGEIYVPLIVDYADDPKMIEAGEKAEVLFIRALCLMKRLRTDGFVADSQLPRLGLSGVDKRADALCRVGLWEQVDGGFLCVSFLNHNKSRAEIDALSEQRAAAGRQGGRPTKANGKQTESTLLSFVKPKTETETETETNPPVGPPQGARAKPKRLIPDDWEPSTTDLAWVAAHYPQLDAWQIAREFRTYWQGCGKPMADWSATYRNRVQKVAGWSQKTGPVRTFL